MVKDIYSAVKRYENRKQKILNSLEFNSINKKLFFEWLNKKEEKLKNQKGREETDKIRWSKTLNKYLDFFVGIDKWFKKPFNELTEEDLIKVREDLEEGRITNKKGEKFSQSTRLDYYNKVFKSNFFEFLGLKEIAKKIFVLEREEDAEVKFFTKEDLDQMTKFSNNIRNKMFLYFLFDTGVRIGTALNIQIKDCEERHNIETKQDYFLIHINKEYTKSKIDSTISLLLPETNELLSTYLKNKKKTKELLFQFSYSNARKLIERVSRVAKIKTKPENKEVSIHDFRKSCATYFLSKKYSIDFVRKRLGHKPSSTVIDKYVNYLGLNEEEAVTQSQEMNYGDLLKKYKETTETVKALDQNLKGMEEKYRDLINKLKLVNPKLNELANKGKLTE